MFNFDLELFIAGVIVSAPVVFLIWLNYKFIFG